MKTIVIIGASSGIGHGVALQLAQAGWRVGALARRSRPLEELARRFPDNIVYDTLDVTAPDGPGRLTAFIERLGDVDTVLYCAGCGWWNPDLDTTDDMRTVATNVAGFTQIINTAARYFVESHRPGHIAAITSVGGAKGLGVSPAYSASKRYQWTYIEALLQQMKMRGANVRFTDIRPGFIATDLLGRGPNHLPMTMRLDYAVRRVVRAIERRRRVAYIDWRWAILTTAWRALPSRLWTTLRIKF